MKRNGTQQKLNRHWSLSAQERKHLDGTKSTRQLGMAVLGNFLELEDWFPREHRDVPAKALRHVAQQLGLGLQLFAKYGLSGRRAEADRQAIRLHFGWRPATQRDSERLIAWLRTAVLPGEIAPEGITEMAVSWFSDQRIEPLTMLGRIESRMPQRGHPAESDGRRKMTLRQIRGSLPQLARSRRNPCFRMRGTLQATPRNPSGLN
jgi:hypothetical protein